MDFEALKGFLGALADAAADRTLPRFRSGLAVDNKHASGFDPVTAADRDAEAAMLDLIHARFPGHGIVGEEHGDEQSGAEFVWVLDPIDGTRSFIAGIPLWGTLIGLLQRGRPVLGMMWGRWLQRNTHRTNSVLMFAPNWTTPRFRAS